MNDHPVITIERVYDDFTRSTKWIASLGPYQAYGLFPTEALNSLIGKLVDPAISSLPK